jgi:hypothetical protein
MAIFNSYVKLPEGTDSPSLPANIELSETSERTTIVLLEMDNSQGLCLFLYQKGSKRKNMYLGISMLIEWSKVDSPIDYTVSHYFSMSWSPIQKHGLGLAA